MDLGDDLILKGFLLGKHEFLSSICLTHVNTIRWGSITFNSLVKEVELGATLELTK